MTRRAVPSLPPGTSGLVRHPALVALSRDHHGVLVQALLLRRAAEAHSGPTARRAARDDYLRFHAAEIAGHMADEEAVLLPLTRGVDDAAAERIVAEHREIETLAARLRETSDDDRALRECLRALGDLLDDHVRFEERAFFMHVQARLDAAALEALGAALDRHRQARGVASGCTLRPRP